jgi:hypothetical protein
MKQTKIETGYSAQLLRRIKLVSVDRKSLPENREGTQPCHTASAVWPPRPSDQLTAELLQCMSPLLAADIPRLSSNVRFWG